ncbi:hypothetical protein ASG93_30455 [Paenibacillus sp. Soil787]|nr:hypothetical protein ASG93_30455 [Paenibacillus sp. Soil787]
MVSPFEEMPGRFRLYRRSQGESYRTAVFYHNEEQKNKAEASKRKIAKSGQFNKPIVTDILPAQTFYPAEDYHQNYHRTNSFRYQMYRRGSGRDQFVEQHWKPRKDLAQLKQFHVCILIF